MENMEKNKNQEIKEVESSETSVDKGTNPIVLWALIIGVIGIIVFGFLTIRNLSKTPDKQSTSPVETSTEVSVSENDTVNEDEVVAEPVYSSQNPEEWTKEDWDKYNASIQAAESSETLYYDANTGKLVTLEEYNKTNQDGTPIEVTPIQDENGNKTIKKEENSTGHQSSSDGQPIGSDDTGSTGNSDNNSGSGSDSGESSVTPPPSATCSHTNTTEQVAEGVRTYIAEGLPVSCYTQEYVHSAVCSDCGEFVRQYTTTEDVHETTSVFRDMAVQENGMWVAYRETYEECLCGAHSTLVSRVLVNDDHSTDNH